MMKQTTIALLAVLGYARCARLDSNYLPPNQNANSYSGPAPYAAPASRAHEQVPIVRSQAQNDGDGTYSFAYESGNGINAQEQGDAGGEGTRAQGGFSYTAPDGQQVHLEYTADENGFQPRGSHLPTPPPIPAEILKAIEQNLADEARGVADDGQYRGDGQGQRSNGGYRY